MKNETATARNCQRRYLVAAVVITLIAAMGEIATPIARAQAANPVFDVVSIKPNTSGDTRVTNRVQPGGRYAATNITLRQLIRDAYRVQEFQIVGGPGWMNSDRFDIVAKAEENPSVGLMALMRQTLLTDRFKVVTHTETREMPVYALIVKQAGKLGPKLRPSSESCGDPSKPATQLQLGQIPCGISGGAGRLSTRGTPITEFAHFLSFNTDRVVLDRTGLTGPFELELEWTPEALQPPRLIGSDGRAGASDLDPLPSLFTAVQEELGLKLESARGRVDVMVIEHAERPTPD
jgi:bla regulator protein blaR1